MDEVSAGEVVILAYKGYDSETISQIVGRLRKELAFARWCMELVAVSDVYENDRLVKELVSKLNPADKNKRVVIIAGDLDVKLWHAVPTEYVKNA